MTHTGSRVASFIFDNSLLLLAGTIAAVIWANVDLTGYEQIAHPLHFWVNDVGMVFFFALAAKEVFEATLPGGPLASPRRALSPLAAAVGGMAAPALIYVALASTLGPGELTRGWAIPCATDIAFSAMVARVIFPAGHPAIPFLLLLAIADDALGLMILAVFYPSGSVSFVALAVLMTAAIVLARWPPAAPNPRFLAVRSVFRRAVVGGAVLRRIPSRTRLSTDRAVHAAWSTRSRDLRSPRRTAAGYPEPVRALVGNTGAVRPAVLRVLECRRPTRGDWAG